MWTLSGLDFKQIHCKKPLLKQYIKFENVSIIQNYQGVTVNFRSDDSTVVMGKDSYFWEVHNEVCKDKKTKGLEFALNDSSEKTDR